jgi:putative transcriptional regulator
MLPLPYAGERIKQLRKREELTQKELAILLETSQYHVSMFESGKEEVPHHVIAMLAGKYELPVGYFERPAHPYSRNDLNFRRTGMPVKTQERIIAVFAELEEFVASTSLHIPQLDITAERPAHATALPVEKMNMIAEETRSKLRLKPGPIGNMTRTLENAGIVVAPLHIPKVDTDSFEGVSSPEPHPAVRLVAYARSKSGDRHRFTLAHELGHLVLHTLNSPISLKAKEEEAHLFAGAFLLPEYLLEGKVSEMTTLSHFAKLKTQTGVSIQATIRRARELGLVSAKRYKILNIQLNNRGWKKKEPVDVGKEKTLLYEKICEEKDNSNVVSIFRNGARQSS